MDHSRMMVLVGSLLTACGGATHPAPAPAPPPVAVPPPAPGFDMVGAKRDLHFWTDEAMTHSYYRFRTDGTFERYHRDVEFGGSPAEQTDHGTWTQPRVGELTVESTRRCHDIERGPLLIWFGGCPSATTLSTLRSQIDGFLARTPGETFTSAQIDTIEPGDPSEHVLFSSGSSASRAEVVGLTKDLDAYAKSEHQHRLTFTVGLLEGTPFLIDDALVRRLIRGKTTRIEMLRSGVFFELPAAQFAKATAGAAPP